MRVSPIFRDFAGVICKGYIVFFEPSYEDYEWFLRQEHDRLKNLPGLSYAQWQDEDAATSKTERNDQPSKIEQVVSAIKAFGNAYLAALQQGSEQPFESNGTYFLYKEAQVAISDAIEELRYLGREDPFTIILKVLGEALSDKDAEEANRIINIFLQTRHLFLPLH